MSSLKARLIKLAAMGFGSGYLPFAPGTAGTLAGIPLFYLISLLPWHLYLIFLIVFSSLAVYLSQAAERLLGKKDAPSIVIDEIAGILWAMFAFPFTMKTVIFGFIFFRLFDIWKPFPIRRLQEELPGGYGIVGDDVLAGLYSNAALHVLKLFSVI